jgi:hypothetical protein
LRQLSSSTLKAAEHRRTPKRMRIMRNATTKQGTRELPREFPITF